MVGDAGALRASCLRPCMLLILSERPVGARALGERLSEFGFDCDTRTLGRRLRSLERGGLIQACDQGLRYRLTRRGRARLDGSAGAIAEVSRRVEAFLVRWEVRGAEVCPA
jgi:repressor of nif and glnA expression